MPTSLYLSYAIDDHTMASRLRKAISDRGTPCTTDDTRAGDRAALPPHVIEAIDGAPGLVVLATPAACASPQVRAEVAHVEARGGAEQIAVIAWQMTAAELAAQWPALAARGCHALPADPTEAELARAAYLAITATRLGPTPRYETVIDFDDIRIEAERVCARVWLGDRTGEFTAPIGPIEAEKLRWYLESYYKWPAEQFERRARAIEGELPMWGQALWHALTAALGADLPEWLAASEDRRRMLTLRMAAPRAVPPTPASNATLAAQLAGSARAAVLAAVAETRELPADDRPAEQIERDARENNAQAALLALPWEMLAKGGSHLFNRDPAVDIRRVIVPREPRAPLPPREPPIRVLVVVARPESAGLIDPQASADALIDAVTPLGDAVELTFLRPPTVAALADALRAKPYDVLHFDGHGVYDTRTGLGYLCFEHRDPARRSAGETELIHGAALRAALGDRRIPLAFLEACQTAQSTEHTDAAVASALLAAGAESVIAMSHSVLVETARRFTEAFYAAVTTGRTIAEAVTRARQTLAADLNRGDNLTLHDYAVPLLYQRGADPTICPGGVAAHGDRKQAKLRAARHATLPEIHTHAFIGRLRERLILERALEDQRLALIIGVGGQGKTTLAAHLGRWLVRCERFRAAAFVSVEATPPIEGILTTIGRALIGRAFAVKDIDTATAELTDWLDRHPGLIIVDNFETLLPPPKGAPAAEALTHQPELLADTLTLIHTLARCGQSRVIITCREPIPDDRFCNGATCHVHPLAPLPVRDAITLVGRICRNAGIRPEAATDEALEDLVRAVGCHPRSLVLLPALLRDRGLTAVTADLHALMTELDALYPDERERSLLASVKLSLDRLPTRWRALIPPLALLRDGVMLPMLGAIFDLDPPQLTALTHALTDRGLAHRDPALPYLRLHPALPAALTPELRAAHSPAEVQRRRAQIAALYTRLAGELYRMADGPNGAAAVALCRRELPNLLWVLDHHVTATDADPAGLDAAIEYATKLEGLLQTTPHRRALTGVAERRAALAARPRPAGWSHAQFNTARTDVDRLLEAGRLAQAIKAAHALVERSEQAAAGGDPYPGAAYDKAGAQWTLGRALQLAGLPAAALTAIEVARAGFEALSEATGDRCAARMASVCLTEGADCLRAMGRHAAAATRYEGAIKAQDALGDTRSAAVGRGQLATVRMLQGDLTAALDGWQQARTAFEALDEPAAVATAWHQIGVVLKHARRFADAEDAFKQSIALHRGRGDHLGVADSMTELAAIANAAGRIEEAVAWETKALAIEIELGRTSGEAISRSNLANRLRRLGRLDEAEAEARQAATLKDQLGVGAEPWTTWHILHNIARARGDAEAAAEARAKAIEWYRRYRAQGGEPDVRNPETALFTATARALADGHGAAVAAELDTFAASPETPDWLCPLAHALAALCRGDRRPAETLMTTCDFDTYVELERLLTPPDPAQPPPT